MHRTRECETRRIAAGSFLLYLRSTRVTEAKQLCGFIEGLANCIVLRRAESDIVAYAAHGHDLGMAARGEEQTIGKCRAVCQASGKCVRFQMIDSDERFVLTSAIALAVVRPTITPPISPGPAAAATPSIASKLRPACVMALAMMTSSASTWARAAISGTTPPMRRVRHLR